MNGGQESKQMSEKYPTSEIKFKVRQEGITGWSDEDVAKRVAVVVGGVDSLKTCPPFERDGKWQLDGSNN